MKNHGFTLIELCIVILLIGVMAGIGYPNLSRMYYSYQLEGCVVNLAGDFRFIMNESLSHKEIIQKSGSSEVYVNVCYGLEFGSRKSYKLYRYIFDVDSKTWVIQNDLTEEKQMPAGAEIYDYNAPFTPHRIIYNNRGEPTSNGIDPLTSNRIVFYSNYINKSKSILIDLNTGKPRIE